MSQRRAIRPGISLAIAASAFSSMSQTKTLAPVAAKARANSRPMPAAPAVIKTRCDMGVLLKLTLRRRVECPDALANVDAPTVGSGIRLGIKRRMSVRDFHLVTEWTLAAPIEAVWQTIAAPEAWPSWWRAVRKVETLASGDARGVGAVRRITWLG